MMYINNFISPYVLQKDDNKCGRLFRPWDSKDAENDKKDSSQDSTVSTTTKEEDDCLLVKKQFNESEASCKDQREKYETSCKDYAHQGFHDTFKSNPYKLQEPLEISNTSTIISRNINQCSSVPNISETSRIKTTYPIVPTSPLPVNMVPVSYSPVYHDLMQTNLAEHLGLPQNDPLVLESISQGYALEEYARVLNQEQQAKLLAAKKQRPKKYKCPHCQVGFSNNGQLKGHIRIHTGERPFKCDDKDCGKTFTRNEELTRHKRIHSGLRPFPCTHCGKRFGRKDHLKKHSRTHYQPKGLFAIPVMMPFEAWASGQANTYPFVPMMY